MTGNTKMACELSDRHVTSECMVRMGLVLAVLVSTAARAADVHVVTSSGVVIDGAGIAGIDDPQTTGRGGFTFRATSTSVALGGVTLSTGDPLPAPLRGTVETIVQGVVAGDRAAVLAATNGPDASTAIFAVDGGVASPLLSFAPAEHTVIRAFAMNVAGDVVYQTQKGPEGAVHVLPRATGVPTTIAGPQDDLRRLGGLVMDDTGAAAWIDRTGHVVYWSQALGPRVVGSGRRTPTPPGGSPIALDATFGLAWVTRDRVERWQPGDATSTIIAFRRESLGGFELRRLLGDVGFRDDGAVAMRVRSKPSVGSDYLCIGSSVERCSDRGRSSAGTTLVPRRAGAVFRIEDGAAAVVRSGDVVPGAGVLADVTSHFTDGGSIVVLGVLGDGRDVLARWEDGQLRSIATSDGVDLSVPVYDADSRGVLIGTSSEEELLVVRNDGRTRTIRPAAGRRFRNLTIDDAVLVRDLAVAIADSLFVARRGRLRPAVVAGARRGTIEQVRLLARGGRAAFATLQQDGTGAVYTIDRTGGPLLRGTLPLPASLLAIDRIQIAALAPTPPDDPTPGVDVLWRIARNGPVELARVGDTTPLGEIASIGAIAVVDRQVLFTAELEGDGARRALLSVRTD